MSSKTISIISYITIIGWIVAFVSQKDATGNPSLSRYHLKQSFGVAILGIVVGFIVGIIAAILPSLTLILSIVNIGILILWIFGIINAANEQEKPVPVVGRMFENKFNFIK